jgi:Icc-related predicted phosphoesterase
MKITVITDLHLEFDHKPKLKLEGGDILLLPGDVCVAAYLAPHRTDNAANKLRTITNDFFRTECAKFNKVYYILGNHEHYNGTYDHTHDAMRKFLAGTNVTLLENEFVDMGDWNLFGATLWTDYDNDDWFAKQAAKQHMSDHYVIKKMRTNAIGTFTPDDAFEVHRNTLDIFRKGMIGNDKPTVVMTHHAPTAKSVGKQYAGDQLNAAYYTNLADVILDRPNIKYWLHGHMHDTFDYMVGDCRVICNPRGYEGFYNPNFNVGFNFEM